MWSTRLVLARPVRSRFSSLRYAATHLVMRSVASFLMSSSMSPPVGRPAAASVRNQCAHDLAARRPHEGTGIVQVEDPERQLVITTQHDRRLVHHVQALVEHLVVREPLVAASPG